MRFYSDVLNFLSNQSELREETISRLVEASLQIKLCWKVNKETLDDIYCYIHSPHATARQIITKSKFIVDAFRDLSIMKNPKAMRLFHDLKFIIVGSSMGEVAWARIIKDRPGGGAVYVIHVSNRQMFEESFYSSHSIDSGDLEEGLLYR